MVVIFFLLQNGIKDFINSDFSGYLEKESKVDAL